jgi:hypothetical protein
MVASRQASSNFYQDLDARGDRLNGANRYSVTSAKDQLAPARGFWSLALCNEHHFFDPNDQNRYSLGTKNDTLQPNTEGSLTLHIAAQDHNSDLSNWLPARDGDFSLYLRAYWPEAEILEGRWTPPAVEQRRLTVQ